MSIVRIVHPDSRTGDLLGLELGGEWFYLRPEDAAAVLALLRTPRGEGEAAVMSANLARALAARRAMASNCMECVEGHAVALGLCADCLASEPLGEAIAAALRAKLQKNKTGRRR